MAEMIFPLDDNEYRDASYAQLWFATRTTGVYSADDHLAVSAAGGMRIALSKGIAWLKIMEFGGIVYGNTETIYFDLAQADGVLKRIDRVVIKFDAITLKGRAQIKQGLFSTNPAPPSIDRTPGVAFEIAVADILISNGAIEITQANITDKRLDETVCGIMRDGVTGIPTQALIDNWNYTTNQSITEWNETTAEYGAQWEAFKQTTSEDFLTWFDSIKDILDENTAAHLLNMINETNSRLDRNIDRTTQNENDIIAINKAIDQTFKIGDTLTTVRKDLDYRWLYCNGVPFSDTTYPDLAKLLPAKTLTNASWTANNQGAATLNSVAYGNGYWVVVGSGGALYYKADNPHSSWISNPQGTSDFTSVAYDNGYWVAVGSGGALYYKQTNPIGAWTANNQGTSDLNSVAYGNGYWVAVGNSGTLRYRANTPNGTWIGNNQGTAAFYAVAYGNGYWVTAGGGGTLYYKQTDPTGSWTANSTTSSYTFYTVAHNNGYWVATGNASGYLRYKATDPTGTWSLTTLEGITRSIIYSNGYWINVNTSGVLSFRSTISGAGTNITLTTVALNSIAYSNGYIVVVGASGNLLFAPIGFVLPVISIGAYTYIKALN